MSVHNQPLALATYHIRGEGAGVRVLHHAVILETNSFKKAKRISEAEEAVVERMRELFRQTGAELGGEREAIDDAKLVGVVVGSRPVVILDTSSPSTNS